MSRRRLLRRDIVVSDEAIAEARRRLALVAVVVAALDLFLKAVVDAPAGTAHHRSVPQLVVVAAIVAYAAYMLPFAGTRRIATAGGLVVGGGAGNVVSALIWNGIPNPFAIDLFSVAFNLADVAALAGVVLLVSGARNLAAPPPPPRRLSPPPPVRQTQPTRYDEWHGKT